MACCALVRMALIAPGHGPPCPYMCIIRHSWATEDSAISGTIDYDTHGLPSHNND